MVTSSPVVVVLWLHFSPPMTRELLREKDFAGWRHRQVALASSGGRLIALAYRVLRENGVRNSVQNARNHPLRDATARGLLRLQLLERQQRLSKRVPHRTWTQQTSSA